MTPAARVQAAIDILDRINEGTSAEKALTTWARGARYAGSGDRAAVRDHVFQVLRCRRSYAALGGGADGRALMRGALISDGIAPETLFTGERHAPAVLGDAELLQGHAPGGDAEHADMPAWLWARFESAFGLSEAMRSAKVLRQRAPVTLRVNVALKNVSQAVEMLSEDGVTVSKVSQCDTALIVVDGARRVAGSRAYREGYVELQDASSQAAMAALDIAPGARVLDYCAGGGGKTLAMAARVDATWFAHDANFARMKDLPDRAHRAGIQVTCLDSDAITSAAPFDLVLCDAPCSGSGTWRRTPEAKWRLTPERLEELRATQLTILEDAEQHVTLGGQLVYATCSILPEENDHQVAAFLAHHSVWMLSKQISWPVTEEGDGFFLACLTKAG